MATLPCPMQMLARLTAIGVLVSMVAACAVFDAAGPGRLATEADAVAAALAVVDLDEPVRVEGVRAGTVRDIYRGAYPSIVRPEDGRAWQAKLAKDAWRVDLIGRMAYEHPQCPGVPILDATAQLILDRQTGEVLLSVYGQPPCPADRT